MCSIYYSCKSKTKFSVSHLTLIFAYILHVICHSRVQSTPVIPGIVNRHRTKVKERATNLRTRTGSYGFSGYHHMLHIMFPRKRDNDLKDSTKNGNKSKQKTLATSDVISFDGDIEFSETALRLCSNKWIIRGSSVAACPTHHQKNWSITKDLNHNILIYQELGSGRGKLYSFVTGEGNSDIQMSRFFKNIVSMKKHPFDERIFNLKYSHRLQHQTLLHKRSGKFLGLKRQGVRGNLVAALVDEENASKVTVRL